MRAASILIIFLCLTGAAEAQSVRMRMAALTAGGDVQQRFTPKNLNRSYAQQACRDTRPPGGTAPLCSGTCPAGTGQLCDISGSGCACQ
jgi:hypothetical protein